MPGSIRPEDAQHAREALDLASRAARAAPNPRVGALVVRDGHVVGRGFHEYARRDHAEVVALAEAGDLARGATLHVTLEPCSSRGRTPPCVDAILAAGITRVVACMSDPNPAHAGRGLRALRRAGVDVVVGVLRAEAVRLNEHWLAHLRLGRPHVTLKLATSVDGRIAAASGDSRWITGPLARERVHRTRRASDAVVVGAGTLVADDPRLTTRLPGPAIPGPLRCVLDPHLTCTPAARLLSPLDDGESGGPALLFTVAGLADDPERWERANRLVEAGAQVIEVPATEDRLALGSVLAILADRGCTGILVEGGARTAGAFLEHGLVDRLLFHVGPLVLGGEGTVPAFMGFGAGSLADAVRLRHLRCEQVGPDVELDAVVEGGFDPEDEIARIAELDQRV